MTGSASEPGRFFKPWGCRRSSAGVLACIEKCRWGRLFPKIGTLPKARGERQIFRLRGSFRSAVDLEAV